MNYSEEAAVPYQPEGEGESPMLESACREAERRFGQRDDVVGFGMGQTFEGNDAVIVYVKSSDIRSALPKEINGYPLIVEVTAEMERLQLTSLTSALMPAETWRASIASRR